MRPIDTGIDYYDQVFIDFKMMIIKVNFVKILLKVKLKVKK